MTRNKVLVTGGRGFIGQHVIKSLKEHGCIPVILDRTAKNLDGEMAFMGDVRDPSAVSEAIGIFVINDIMGMALSSSALVKAKCLIFSSVGIPYAYYLPKVCKRVRLRFWGVWPSVGRYEPE